MGGENDTSHADCERRYQVAISIAREALEEWEYNSGYKGEFLNMKHGDAARIAEHRKALGLTANEERGA